MSLRTRFDRTTSSPFRDKAKGQLRIKSALEVAAQRGMAEWVEVDAEKDGRDLQSVARP